MSNHSRAVMVALLAGLLTTGLSNQLGHAGDWTSPAKYLEARGFLFGIAAALVAYGMTRVVMTLLLMRGATLAMGIVLGLVGLGFLFWNLTWGIDLMSQEGAVWWPLALVPLGLSILLVKRARRFDRGAP